MGGRSSVVSITDSCDDLEDPVECENVLSVVRLVLETSRELPRCCAIRFHVVFSVSKVRFIWSKFAIGTLSEPEPDASHNMGDIDDTENE